MTDESQFTVFYDGACPLCRREIAFYRRRRGADDINWQDVSASSESGPAPGLSCEAARARFHVMTREGRLRQGGEAFAALWAELPGFRSIGRLFLVPPFRWLINIAYRLFLPVRPALQKLARSAAES